MNVGGGRPSPNAGSWFAMELLNLRGTRRLHIYIWRTDQDDLLSETLSRMSNNMWFASSCVHEEFAHLC